MINYFDRLRGPIYFEHQYVSTVIMCLRLPIWYDRIKSSSIIVRCAASEGPGAGAAAAGAARGAAAAVGRAAAAAAGHAGDAAAGPRAPGRARRAHDPRQV